MVLLIDDDATTNFLHRRAIKKSPHEVDVIDVLDGDAAFKQLEELREAGKPAPALIFLDINMPRCDGWQFLESYRTLPKAWRGKTLLYMLTTSVNVDEHERARAYEEVTDVLDKMMDTGTFSRVYAPLASA